MDYQQSRAYVKDADRYAGGALDLTNIKELMKRLGNPQDQLKYVHVAATFSHSYSRNQWQGIRNCLSVYYTFGSWISCRKIYFPIRIFLS